MLVLQRDLGRPVRIKIGDIEVWVMIGRNEQGHTQILIEAPLDVQIMRDELLPIDERMACHPNAHRWRHILTGPIYGRAAMPGRGDRTEEK